MGPVKPPCKDLTLRTEIKISVKKPVDSFKVSIIKAGYTKNIFGSHFPTEHNGVTDYFLINRKFITNGTGKTIINRSDFIIFRKIWQRVMYLFVMKNLIKINKF